jgi:hypothetical protein
LYAWRCVSAAASVPARAGLDRTLDMEVSFDSLGPALLLQQPVEVHRPNVGRMNDQG